MTLSFPNQIEVLENDFIGDNGATRKGAKADP